MAEQRSKEALGILRTEYRVAISALKLLRVYFAWQKFALGYKHP